MKPTSGLDAGTALLQSWQQCAKANYGWADWIRQTLGIGKDPQLEVGYFEHGGSKLRGLRTTIAINKGEVVLTLPKETILAPEDVMARRFQVADEDLDSENAWATHMALWLAEKAKLVKLGMCGTSAKDSLWASYIRSLPTLDQYRDEGYPIVASDKELHTFYGLPHFDTLFQWATQTKQEMAKAVTLYNAYREGNPRLTLEDALWGRNVISSRGFKKVGVLPLADMMNHSSTRNLVSARKKGIVHFFAIRDIQPGEELTINYGKSKDALDLIFHYGMFEGAAHEHWSQSDCAKIFEAGLEGAGPLSRKLLQLASQSCDALHPKVEIFKEPDTGVESGSNLPRKQAFFPVLAALPRLTHVQIASALETIPLRMRKLSRRFHLRFLQF